MAPARAARPKAVIRLWNTPVFDPAIEGAGGDAEKRAEIRA